MTKTLLIVDDEPEIRAELAEYFAAKGYRVERAPGRGGGPSDAVERHL